MKTIFFLSLSLWAILSCTDVKKSSQLSLIDDMTKKILRLKKDVMDNKVDSSRSYSIESREIELRIKNNYLFDTIDLEFGKKMDRHKHMRKTFGSMDQQYNNVLLGCDETIESLHKLQRDIENSDGNRANYPEYLQYEKTKLEQLQVLSKEYIDNKKNAVRDYKALHKEIEDFSWKIFHENKKHKQPFKVR